MGSRPLHPLDAIYHELTDIARALPREQADALASAVRDARRVFVGGDARLGWEPHLRLAGLVGVGF